MWKKIKTIGILPTKRNTTLTVIITIMIDPRSAVITVEPVITITSVMRGSMLKKKLSAIFLFNG